MALTRTQVRGLAGLAAGLTVGLGLLAWISGEAAEREHIARGDRLAMVRARMVADVVVRAGGVDQSVHTAVARVAAADPAIAWVRVVRLSGSVLEASTVAADFEGRSPPRRLERSEKWLYDVGQELQAARETNLEEGTARKHEILVVREAAGRRRVGAPVLSDGVVAGVVHVETAERPAPDRAPLAPLLLAFAPPLLLGFILVRPLRNRRWAVALLCSVLLVGALGVFSWFTARTLGDTRRQSADAVVQGIHQSVAIARAALPEVEHSYVVADWDVDPFGRPRGLVDADGRANRAALEREADVARGWVWRREILAATLALLVLLSVALGFAAHVGTTVVRHRLAYTYATPALAGMLLLVFLPFLYGLVLSFTGATIYNSNEPIAEIWVGVRNFWDILTDVAVVRETAAGRIFNYQNFYWTFGFTVVWTLANVAIGVSVGLALALALNTPGLALRPVYRVLLIMPWAVPNYITALVWRGMFHKQFGVINQALLIVGGDSISWFEHPLTSFTAILATNGWLSFPFMMVISLGSLQSIPGELYEAARVDGASRWQQFRSITLPSLKPALVPAIILSVIWTFNMFNIPYLVSGGEPAHATEILITQAYKIAFEQYRYGYAAAYSMVIFLILLAYGTWQNRVSRATEAL